MANIDEVKEKMSETIEDIKEFAKEKTEGKDEAAKEKVAKLVEKASEVINNAKEKIGEATELIKDDEQLNKFINTITIKVQEASDFTKMKISELIPEQEKIDKLTKDLIDSFDRFTESEGVQTVVRTFQNLSDQVNEYLSRPEVKAKINKAKKATLNAAEKGMEQLRKVLEVDEEETVVVDNNTNDEQ